MKPSEVNFPDSVENVGRPIHFDPDHYLDSVEQMIAADEIVTALYMLDHLPGYYRDHIPQRALDIKSTLYRQIMSVYDYANDKDEIKENNEKIRGPLHLQWNTDHYKPRGELIVNLVKEVNERGKLPVIFEFGAANKWIPAALKDLNLDHRYFGMGITSIEETLLINEKKTDIEVIFCCFETIEHLWNPDDIFHAYVKCGIEADHVLIGCPKYTLYGGMPNWDSRQLGHIRTYTPKELHDFCLKHWHGYSWFSYQAHMMVMKGTKIG